MSDAEKDLQNAVMNFRMLEARLDALIKQRDIVIAKMSELGATMDGLGELGKSREVLFSLGSDAYTVGQVTDRENVLVDIGAGILLRKSVDEGRVTLNRKKDELEKSLNDLQGEIKGVSSMMEQLNAEIQRAYQGAS